MGATAARRFTAHAAWRAMETAIDEHGAPRQLISDNGLQFKSGKGHKPVYFQERLAALGIAQLSSRPRHPQTCRKLERYHCTFKEFYADHGPAHTVEELQQLCDAFRWQSRYAGDLGVSAGSSYRAGGPSNREVRDVRSLPGPQRVCRRP
nr:hypothetical protein [Rhodococcus pyridinivorans]